LSLRENLEECISSNRKKILKREYLEVM